MERNKVVLPGEYLCDIDSGYIPGFGVRVEQEKIHSILFGKVRFNKVNENDDLKLINVLPERKITAPESNSIVFGRVVNVNVNSARMRILCADNSILESDSFLGSINKRDVRKTEVDKVRILDSFVPGDLVKAKVLSMGSKKICNLTTAERDLGVVFGKSKNGYQLQPEDEKIGICTKTKIKEKRKFAILRKPRKRKRKKNRNQK